MSDFYDLVKKETTVSKDNETLTDNGAVVYESTMSSLVDFEASINSLRNKTDAEIQEKIARAYTENPKMATKMIFQIGDIREGKGERKIFNNCMNFLSQNHPKIALELLPLIPEYTRWDYLIKLSASKNEAIANASKEIVTKQLKQDIKDMKSGKPISLCAKWMPSIQTKKPEDRKVAFEFEKALGLDHKQYRKMLASLREKLNIIEKNLSQKNIEEIDYEKMTSKQMLKYSDKLKEKDSEKFAEYQKNVAEGKAKIHADVLTPVDIVHKYTDNNYFSGSVKDFDETIENLWSHLKDTIKEQEASTIVIRDGSGSMCSRISNKSKTTNLEVATALTVYCAEKMHGSMRDKFITFSSRPELIDMSKLSSLHDKLDLCYHYDDCSNTDLKKTFDLLLKTLKNNNIPESDAPKNILICSDMQFDHAHTNSIDETNVSCNEYKEKLFSIIKKEWEGSGYQLPTLIFWNLETERTVFPEIDNENGVIYVSGYTTDNLDMVLSGKISGLKLEEQLFEMLNKPRYDKVEKAFNVGLTNEQPIAKQKDIVDIDNMHSNNESKQESVKRNNIEEISL